MQEVGVVSAVYTGDAGTRLGITTAFAGELRQGDSVCVEGVCLTATTLEGDGFDADVMNQTLSLTTLGELEDGLAVNLEPALRAGEPLGGHIVQGHVDAVGEVRSVAEDGFARRVRVGVPGRARALPGRARVGDGRGRQPHGRRAGCRLVRGVADPRDAGADDPRRRGEPGPG